MAIIISIGAKISEYTVEPIGRQLGYLFNYKSNVENLRTQMQHLKDERDKLQQSIDEAKENNEEEIEAGVANWLSRVDRMISQHSEKFLTNEGRANISCLSGKFLDLGSRHWMSRKAKKMAMEAAIEIRAAGEFHKGAGSAVSAYGGPSSPQSAGKRSISTSSKEGALTCQSSVLDNDIGSIGPPVSGSPSIPKLGLGSMAAQKPSSSMQKLNSSGVLKNDYEEASTENEESTMPSTSFSSVPTKSSEMDSKILQQLDKLVLPKDKLSEPNLLTSMDKSPTNMSPSMLHGQALKSLEAVDSSNFLGDIQDKNKLDASLNKKIPNARDTSSLEQDTVVEHGQLKIVACCDEATDAVNDVDSAVSKKNTSMNIEIAVCDTPIFASPPEKKWAFRRSVPEDFLELDDDDDDVYSNGAASHSSTDGTQKVDTFSAERKSHNTEAVLLEKPPLASLECKPSTSAVNKNPDPETSDGSVSAKKDSNFVNTDASSPSMAVLRTEVATQSPLTSDVASPTKLSNVALPIFSLGDKVASTKDSDAASPTSSFGSKPADEVPETFTTFASSPAVVTESAATESGSFPEPKPETSSSFPTVPANTTDSVLKVPEPSKVGINDISNCGVFSSVPETGLPSLSTPAPTPTPATSTFSFGNLPNSSILDNGSLASTSAFEIRAAGEFHKGVGSAVSAYGGPSFSRSACEQSLSTSSKEGALKCQSSVLDNDIGSIGPPVSGSISVPKTGLGSVAAQRPSSSIQKLNSSGELKNDYEEASTENVESTMPSTSFSSVPTKSSEMDSKILQQLDKLVLPKDELSEPNVPTSLDKSPSNMSPSMLHGQALKSLEAVDSSKFLGDVQDKLDASLDKKIADARDTTSLEQDTVDDSGQLKIVASCGEATDVVNDVDSAVPKKNTSMNIETTVCDTPIFVASPPEKKWAFRMSVPEDFLELDDDDDDDDVYSNGAASHSSTDGTQKVDTFSAERKSHNTEAVILPKPPLAFLECKPSTSAVNKKPDPETSDVSVSADKNSNFVNADASSPSVAVLCTEVATQSPLISDVASPTKVSNVALPMFSLGDKVASTKDSDAASPTSSFGSKPADEVPETFTTFASSPAAVTESAATESGSFPEPKPETSSSFPSPFQFSSAVPSASTPFQFEIELILPAPQNPFPFSVSGSMGLLPEGSNFSIGSGGGGVDKSSRKFYKVKGKSKVKGKCNRRFYKECNRRFYTQCNGKFYKVKGKQRRM